MAKKKILIVDDDRDLLRGLTVRLKAAGYDVSFAVDGISAISVAQQSRPDALILDIGLPGGDGFMVLDRFRVISQLSTVPIVVLTATDPSINKERALHAGAVAFLQKPADNKELLATIQRALGESPDSGTDAPPTAGKTTKRIMVVDDDPDLLRGLTIRLKASGFEVIVASDAIAAVSRARKDSPDLIILDIGMPGGDGFQVMERLKAVMGQARIPIIVVSARDPSINKERALQSGASAYFQKPVDNMALLNAINRALEAPRGLAALR